MHDQNSAPKPPDLLASGLAVQNASLAVAQRAAATLGLTRTLVDESSAAYWYDKGQLYAEQAQWEPAVYCWRQCAKREPTFWPVLIQLAGGLAEIDQPEQAAQALQQAFECNHSDWETFATELRPEKWQSLGTCLEQRKGTAADRFTLLFGLTLVYHALEDFERAHQVLEIMQSLYEHHEEQLASWYQLYGNVHFAQDKWETSLAYYDRAIEQNPQHDAAYLMRGNAKYGLEDYVGAIVDFDHAIEINPRHQYAYNVRGGAKYNLQDYIGAIDDYGLAIELNPNSHKTYISRYKAKANLHLPDAVDDLDKAIMLSNGEYTWFYLKNIKDIFYSNKNEALNILNKVVGLVPDYYYPYSIRAKFYMDMSLYDLAIIDYSYIIEIKSHWSLFSKRATANLYAGNHQKSISDYDDAILLAPDNYELFLKRSKVKFFIGDSLGGKSDLVQAKELGADIQGDLDDFFYPNPL